MKIKKTILLLILVITSFDIYAQKFELGKVTIAELQEKEHPKDPSAPATILFEKGKVEFEYDGTDGFSIITEMTVKIKIYKKEGYDWANKIVPYYSENNSTRETVNFSDAVTYNLVDGKIEKTKIKSEGEFNEIINKYSSQKKITLPNVKEGSVIEYEYSLRSKQFGSLKDWYFQNSIPVNFSEFKTYIPEYYTYKPSQKGYIFPKVTAKTQIQSITFTDKEINPYTESRNYYYDKLDYVENQITYIAENIPAMKDELYVNNIDNYTSSISHELAMIKYPHSLAKSFSMDWEAVAKTIYADEDFGAELNKTGYFEDEVKSLIAGLTSPEEKIVTLFEFVKSKVKWNGNYGYWCHDGVKKAYITNTGNAAEINLMLTSMLRYAGLNANPVLISTRLNGITYYPNTDAYNYVIAAVETPDGSILLDATEKFSIPNVLPLRDLNWMGRLIRKNETSTSINLIPQSLSKKISNLSFLVNSNGSVEGKIRNQFTNHKALEFRKKYNFVANESYLEDLENKNNTIEITNYKRENELEIYNPLIEIFSFKSIKDVEIINDKMYFSPLLFLATKENIFKQEIREYPIDFGFPTETKYNINIEIPDGYSIEFIPKPTTITTVENIGTFKYMIENKGGKIQVSITTDINFAIVGADFYDVIKAFFQQIVDKETEKIVLKKI